MRLAGELFQWSYFAAGLASLIAVSVVLYRLRYGWLAAAPTAATVVLTLVFQAMTAVAGSRLFGFGVYATLMPALSLAPPIFVVAIAFSKRLSAPPETPATAPGDLR